jgi:CelD/BcsL family acetyltransferase involved in cellulose biosynthesis
MLLEQTTTMSAKANPTDRSSMVIALDSAASVIAGVRRVAEAERAADAELTAEWQPLSGLASVADDWRMLAAHALEPNVFYDPAFALHALPVFGHDAGAVLVWSQTTPRRLLGLFPARIERRRYGVPMSVLAGWTHPYAPLGTPLVEPHMAEPVIGAWLSYLAQDPRMPHLLLLPYCPAQGGFATALDNVLGRAALPSVGFDPRERAVLMRDDSDDDYLDRALGKKKIRDLARQRRRLAEYGPVAFSVATGHDNIGAAVNEFLALEAAGWKGRSGSAVVQQADIRAFLHGAVGTLAVNGNALVVRLTVGEKLVAGGILLVNGDTAWFWKIAYDEAFAPCSPGILLAAAVTESLLADHSIARTDSCASADHSMMDKLWRDRLPLTDRLIGLRPDAPFAMAARLEKLRRSAIAAAKSTRDLLRRR